MDCEGNCCAWLSVRLGEDLCRLLGASSKETIIYELELLACCLGMDLWASCLASAYPVLYGDNDSVRFALSRGIGLGLIANTIMQQRLETEVKFNINVWCARVPTEANIADIPSRFLSHPFLSSSRDESSKAWQCLEKFLKRVQTACDEAIRCGEEGHLVAPQVRKKEESLQLHQIRRDDETLGTRSNCLGRSEQNHLRVQQFCLRVGVGRTSLNDSCRIGQKDPPTIHPFSCGEEGHLVTPQVRKKRNLQLHQIRRDCILLLGASAVQLF